MLLAAIAVAVTDTDSSLAGSPTVVNSTLDTSADDGICTLREAIGSANSDTASGPSNGECSGPDFDVIHFDISASDPGYDNALEAWVIKPAPLPPITSVVTIDGYTQPGALENDAHSLANGTNAQLVIVLDG